MTKQLAAMLKIAQAIKERDLAVLAAKQARRKGLNLARRDLMGQTKSELASMTSEPMYRKSFELPRQIWRDAKIQGIAQMEINAFAEVEMQKKILQKSIGRASVLERLSENALAERRRKQNL